MNEEIELTILMPCLNEAATVGLCVEKAMAFLSRYAVAGEVLVVDNGSLDGSPELAIKKGARVVTAMERGYGAALQCGIEMANGQFIIMGDADDSYDFSALEGMLEKLRAGSDLVMGNRFQGGIATNAMPFLHRYVGNPVLSFIGRLFYRSAIGDFHCGIRGFRRDAIRKLRLQCNGMEFASEMVVKSALHRLRISEVPVRLYKDGRGRPPHLRTWRDGWRHLKFLLLHSPRWLFLLPGALLFFTGLAGMLTIGAHAWRLAGLGFDIHTLSYAGAAITLGVQMMLFAVLTRFVAAQRGWLPENIFTAWFARDFSLELGLIFASTIFLGGVAMSFYAFGCWAMDGFGELDPRSTMRLVIPSVTLLAVGGEMGLSAFVLEAIRQPDCRGSTK
ncbi:glycosyltransferase family 2 protein [Pseudoxanthomonas sp. GM95]|uniref:glycosyltransferase family 2 protein n=1 Tax=Pseudoxanthomonas sp. GM95 TaxID=1881043 RepID=UPI001113507B|nr:glycosyltransferase family 2 protein [Pseudoxanthomonas sp. GM95]